MIIKKVIQIGSSIGITIDKKLSEKLKLRKGDYIKIKQIEKVK